MEKKDNIFKRLKNFISSKRRKIDRYLKWYKVYDNKKYFIVKQKIINILIDEINEIFKEPFINENILNDDYWIKPDWGSIAPVSKKEFCEE